MAVEEDDTVAVFFVPVDVVPIIPAFDVLVCVVVAGVCDILVVVIFDELIVPVAGAVAWA
ncbi:hypothetical protein AXW84_16755 [Hymenobacter sp. PAMC 26628]|nr:hypothetical protein AXW84_16755 [Hymenobacter sp. PAMC 26628]